MKTVLLTGVAGFIGAHTLEHIMENTDWSVFGVDSLQHAGKYERIEMVLRKNPTWQSRFQFKKLDLALPWSTDELPVEVDYIINMASESHVDRSIKNPVPFLKNNLNLTIHMLEFARKVKPKVFIQISTDEVYGAMYDHPFVEWERLIPSNPYSASKASQEMIAISYWRTYDVPVVITNTMNNIGEMQDVEKFVPMLIRDISEDKIALVHGTEEEIGTRFYLHARNHADALLFILNNCTPHMYKAETDDKPDRYNIVGEDQVSNLEMAERIAKLLGKRLRYRLEDYHTTRPGHDMHYGLDGSKLKKLGWVPPLGLEESLRRTVENYMEHKDWLR